MFISKNCSTFALVIELERHIEILLLSNDCVIVPGLGGFMTHHVEAHFDERDYMFLPPLRTLGFNPQLNINDSLLAQSYIEAYDISYPEALQRIENEVNELRQHIQNEGSYELNDIGVLALNEDGNYVFTPCESGILTPTLYGLSSFEMKPLQQKAAKPVPVIVEEPEKREASEDQPAAKIFVLGDDKTDEEEYHVDEVVRIKYSWIRNAVTAAAIIVALIVLTLPTGKTEMVQAISNINNGLLFGMMSEDTNTSKIEIKKVDTIAKKVVSEIRNDSVETVPPAPETVQHTPETVLPSPEEDTYCIVLASYVSMRNAHAFVEQLKQEGYEQSEVFVRNNVTRVIYGHYPSEQEAYNDLQRIHRHKGLSEAWVMKI